MFRYVVFIFTITNLICSFSANAQSNTTFRLGGFHSNIESSIDVIDPLVGKYVSLDLESELHLEETQFLPFFEVIHTINNHNIYLQWKQLHRDSIAQSTHRTFVFNIDDNLYHIKAGTPLDTSLDIDIARMGYGFDVIQTDDYQFGFSLGLHALFIKNRFAGNLSQCKRNALSQCTNNTALPHVIDEKVSPLLPDVGFYGSIDLQPGVKFKAHAQYLFVEFDDLKGELLDIRLGVETNIAKHWYATASINYYEVDVDYSSQLNHSGVKITDYHLYYSFTGPMISVSYQF